MNINPSQFTLKVMITVLAVCSALQAQDQNQQPVVGSWQITISPVPAGPQFSPFPGLITISSDGNLAESDASIAAVPVPPPNPFCSCTVVTLDQSHGVWKKVGDRKYQIKFVQLGINTNDSSLVLTATLQFTIEVSGANDQFQGQGSFQLTDAHGMPIQGFSGAEQIQGQRITISGNAGAQGAVTIRVTAGAEVFPAGANTFQVTTNQITLDASQSSSSNGSPLSYSWVSSTGSQPAAIIGSNTAAPVIQLSTKTTYQLTLTVMDASGSTATQNITIQYV